MMTSHFFKPTIIDEKETTSHPPRLIGSWGIYENNFPRPSDAIIPWILAIGNQKSEFSHHAKRLKGIRALSCFHSESSNSRLY
jgi:hypothetical protein